MNTGLSVNDVVNVSVLLSPPAAQVRNFGTLLILGDSDVVDTTQRLRLYTSIGGVAGDFGVSTPEYQSAALFFAQSPKPAQVYIGRWAATPSRGGLQGGPLTVAQQVLSNFTAIANGGIAITIDGSPHNLTGLDFSGVTNLNGVASIIQASLGGAGTVVWNAVTGNFQVRSSTTGALSTVAYATTGPGQDISTLLRLDITSGGYTSTGATSETSLAAVTALDQMTSAWYGLMLATTSIVSLSDQTAIATYIEAAANSHILGLSSIDAAVMNPAVTNDIASLTKAANYGRTFVQYSQTPLAVASVFGRAFTVDFLGSNTTITLKFQGEPGVTAESLTETQANALNAKNANVYVNYNNNTAILQQGTMANGQFFDTVHGTDWLENDIQTAVFNLLYLVSTKIPQTDAGVNQLVTVVANRLDQAVENGLIAPGVWNGPPVGNLLTGQTLIRGYYVYAPSVATQSAAARAARQSPVIQAAIKIAGAIHSVSLIISVNN